MSDWVADNKGEGPWDFVEQPEKLGYVNNPRWTDAPASLVEHEPCGYWFKTVTPTTIAPGILYGAGTNEQGALGNGPFFGEAFWELAKTGDWDSLAFGSGGSLAIKTNREIWGVGNNSFGDLGNVGQLFAWTKLMPSTWRQAAMGNLFSWLLNDNGTLWSSGLNSTIGVIAADASINIRAEFQQVGSATNWARVAAGGFHSLALTDDGRLYGCGYNAYGQLGALVGNQFSLTQFGSGVVRMCGGYANTFTIRSNGTVWNTGENFLGALGVGDGISRFGLVQESQGFTDVVSITAGARHSVILRSNGTLWGTGSNATGQLGLGDTVDRNVYTQIGTDTDWASVHAFTPGTMALKRDGSLWTCGDNAAGALGFTEAYDRLVLTQPNPTRTWVKLGNNESYCAASWPHSYAHSLVLRATGAITPVVALDRPSPIWTMPTT